MKTSKLQKLMILPLLLAYPILTVESCPVVKLQEDFKPALYMGTWYEQLRDKTIPFEKFECVHTKYELNPDNSVSVYNAQFNDIKNEIDSIRGKATFNGAVGKVKFFWYMPAGDYRVVATDYENYAVVYSCEKILWFRMQAAWILTREKKPDEALVKKAFAILKERVPSYNWEDFHQTKQEGSCRYSVDLREESG